MDDLEKDLLEDGPISDTEEDSESPREAAPADTLRVLEALLFASDELLTTARLKAILPGNLDAREIGKMVERINQNLQKERHPFEVVEIGGGYQFKTVAYYHPWVRQIFQEKAAKRLSMQALECLSIIAYRQPLSKAEIEAIRGVLSDGAMKTLLEKRLITITGRSDKPGRPLLYGTTQDFLHYFGLGKITDLPKIEEFEAMVRQKVEDLPIEELKIATEQARAEASGGDEATIEITLPEQTAEASLPPAAPEPGRAVRPDETAVFEMKLPLKTEDVVNGETEATAPELIETVITNVDSLVTDARPAPAPDKTAENDTEEPHPRPSGKKRKKKEAVREIRIEQPAPEALSTDGETVRQSAIAEKAAPPAKSGRDEDTAEAVFEMSAGAPASGGQPRDEGREDDKASDSDAVFEISADIPASRGQPSDEGRKNDKASGDDAVFEVKL